VHPSLAKLYHARIEALHEALNCDDGRAEAAEIVRSLIEAIVLVPADGDLDVEVVGDLAGILAFAAPQSEKPSRSGREGSFRSASQVKLVAGAGFEPATFRL
jgi:hypothetical protein